MSLSSSSSPPPTTTRRKRIPMVLVLMTFFFVLAVRVGNTRAVHMDVVGGGTSHSNPLDKKEPNDILGHGRNNNNKHNNKNNVRRSSSSSLHHHHSSMKKEDTTAQQEIRSRTMGLEEKEVDRRSERPASSRRLDMIQDGNDNMDEGSWHRRVLKEKEGDTHDNNKDSGEGESTTMRKLGGDNEVPDPEVATGGDSAGNHDDPPTLAPSQAPSNVAPDDNAAATDSEAAASAGNQEDPPTPAPSQAPSNVASDDNAAATDSEAADAAGNQEDPTPAPSQAPSNVASDDDAPASNSEAADAAGNHEDPPTPAPSQAPSDVSVAPAPAPSKSPAVIDDSHLPSEGSRLPSLLGSLVLLACGCAAFNCRKKILSCMNSTRMGTESKAPKYHEVSTSDRESDDEEWGWNDEDDSGHLEMLSTSSSENVHKRRSSSDSVTRASNVTQSTSASQNSFKRNSPTSTRNASFVDRKAPSIPPIPAGSVSSMSFAVPAAHPGLSLSKQIPPARAPATQPIVPTADFSHLGGMKITTLGPIRPKVPLPKKTPVPAPSQEDDIFASLGLSAKPTFSHAPAPTPATTSSSSRWAAPSAVVAAPSSAPTIAGTSIITDVVGDTWDDDGDLDDLLDD